MEAPYARAGGDALMETSARTEEPMQEQAFWHEVWPLGNDRDEVS